MTNRRTKLLGLLLLITSVSAVTLHARASIRRVPAERLPALALEASSPDRDAAIERLRAMGPEGLRLLLADPLVRRALPAGSARGKSSAVAEGPGGLVIDASLLRETIDRVAGQRDALASRLYWHADLEQAKRLALRENKPILSLRLLGRLDEELSCANSRFFRSVLYPNAEVQAELRDRFVLHWESVRPVPKLTVDFGDGRTLETTISGNSAHLVLLPDGRPIDALPGLWGSRAFVDQIRRARGLAADLTGLPRDEQDPKLRAWHLQRLQELRAELASDAARLDERERRQLESLLATTDDQPGKASDDIVFSTGAFTSFPAGTKMTVELPLIGSIIPDVEGMRGELPDEVWSALARLHEDESALDESAREFVRAKERGRLLDASPDDGDTVRVEPLLERLQRSIAEESVRSRHLLAGQVHEWFVEGEAPADASSFTERLYREVFMSPVNDAWLGLVPPDAYSGLEGGGRHGTGT